MSYSHCLYDIEFIYNVYALHLLCIVQRLPVVTIPVATTIPVSTIIVVVIITTVIIIVSVVGISAMAVAVSMVVVGMIVVLVRGGSDCEYKGSDGKQGIHVSICRNHSFTRFVYTRELHGTSLNQIRSV